MKKETLRIHHLEYRYTHSTFLEDVSFSAMEGEVVGTFGAIYSGRDLLFMLMSGEIDGSSQPCSAYVDGEKIISWSELCRKTYRIHPGNYVIDDWSIAEYVGLVTFKGGPFAIHKFHLEMQIAELFDRLGIEFDVTRRLRELSALEKRVADVVKAIHLGARVILIEDEFEGVSPEEILQFGEILRSLIQDRMTALVSSHSVFVVRSLSDKYIIFNKGRIVKKCAKNYLQTKEQLELYLLGGSPQRMTEQRAPVVEEYPLYQVHGVRLGGKPVDFHFSRGEITTITMLNQRDKERLFLSIAGQLPEDHALSYVLDGMAYDPEQYSQSKERRIASIRFLGRQEELFPAMTVGENLILPSLKKLTAWDYITSGKKLQRTLLADAQIQGQLLNQRAGEMDLNHCIRVTLDRWYIYKPQVIVLYEPFALCDAYGIDIVRNALQNMANWGTSVILVTTRDEYVEDLSNRILNF